MGPWRYRDLWGWKPWKGPAMHGAAWKLSEDRRLLRLYEKHSGELRGWPLWNLIAEKLKRTNAACATRYGTLRAAIQRCGKLKEKRC